MPVASAILRCSTKTECTLRAVVERAEPCTPIAASTILIHQFILTSHVFGAVVKPRSNRALPRLIRILPSMIFSILLTAGCSGILQQGKTIPSPASGPPTTPARAVPTPADSKPASTSAPVPKVSAACPLLPANELKTLLGSSSSRTNVTATEDTPDISAKGAYYTCNYGSNGNTPFSLGVFVNFAAVQTAQETVDAIGKASKVNTHNITGVGDAAVFYTLPDGNSLIAASKRTQDEIHTVTFAAPAVVPQQKFIDLARVVIGRL